jgi:cytidylate kinase
MAWQKKRLAAMYDLDIEDIVIHDVIKGSTIAVASST